jgi:hypothetical protein
VRGDRREGDQRYDAEEEVSYSSDMSLSLSLCPSCSRHVRENICPFCGGDVAPAVAATLPRVARIALLGAAAAAVATACSSPQPMYGAVIPDSSADAPSEAGQDAIATFYGGVPIDSGTE